jgi:hypothetical protein
MTITRIVIVLLVLILGVLLVRYAMKRFDA